MSAPPLPPLARRVAGSGPPVVFANGGMMTFAGWEPVAAPLRAERTTLLFDFRGQMLSPGEPPPETTDLLAWHADELAHLLDEAGWQSAHLVGTSFGAMVATRLAARSPERVRSLVLATVMDRATELFDRQTRGSRELVAEILAGGDRTRFWDLLMEGVYSPAYRQAEAAAFAARRSQLGLLPASWFSGLDRLLAAVEHFDLTPALQEVRCPALVVIAAGDRVMDAERSHALASALQAEIAVHPTAGHALVAEDPAWLAGVCREFLLRAEESQR